MAANSSLAGSGLTAQGVALVAATPLSPAPLYAETLGNFGYSTAVDANAGLLNVDLSGRYVLLANSYAIVTIGQSAKVGFASLTWAEVPV